MMKKLLKWAVNGYPQQQNGRARVPMQGCKTQHCPFTMMLHCLILKLIAELKMTSFSFQTNYFIFKRGRFGLNVHLPE
jgi:hypothetical protein